MEPSRELDSKTAWELYKKVDNFDKKLTDMKSEQDIILKDLQSEQKKNHYEMLDAVNESVNQYGKLMDSNLSAFRFEIKSMFDDHERRITDQEQKEISNNMRLFAIETNTKEVPIMKIKLDDIDTRTINFTEVEDTVSKLVNAPGAKAIKAWLWAGGICTTVLGSILILILTKVLEIS